MARRPGSTSGERETVELDVDFLDADGDGVARQGGRLVTIPFTLPGERVRVRLGPGGARPALTGVVRRSPHRIVPRCPHAGDAGRDALPCGGCSWQHIEYAEQLRLKTALVDRLIGAAVPGAPPARPTLASTPAESPWAYRHKVHFAFGSGDGGGALTMGHYARGSRRLVPIRECPVHAEAGNRIAFALGDVYRRAGVAAAAAERRGRNGTLKSVTVRVAQGTAERMTTVVVSGEGDRRLREATRAALAGNAGSTSLHVNIHPKEDAFIFGRETKRISGPARMREVVAGLSFLVSPTAFFQTNVAAAAILVELVLAAVPEGATVLDLYAGAGLFALPLARRGTRVLAVESSRQAVEDGEASRDLNRIPAGRCRFVARPVESALPRLPAADVVVMDPPREGCSRRVLQEVFANRRPRLAVYVSCNPEALARDLGPIVGAGYTIVSIQPVDMFPHTAHVETVVVLEPRIADRGSRIAGCQPSARR